MASTKERHRGLTHTGIRWPWLASAAGAALGLAVIAIFAGLIYRPILRTGAATLIPWSSDAMGHLLKAGYLLDQWQQGAWYPTLLPGWYLGLELFRAYPPLPYYLLAAGALLTGSLETAGHWFVVVCAVAGSAGWLLFRRWLGWPIAILGGVLFLALPDNIRVAFAEGNLPRVLATALLPLMIYCLLRGVSAEGRPRHWFTLALGFALLVLIHPMMAGIYAAVCGGLVVLGLAARQAAPGPALRVLAGIGLGLGLSAWWLVPGMSGGLTDLDASAMAEGLAVVPLSQHLDPLLRGHDPEQPYVGVALLALGAVAALVATPGSHWPRVLALVGLAALFISTTAGYSLYRALPISHLLWPIRFLGIASLLLLLATLWQLPRLPRWPTVLSVVGALLLMVDASGSLASIRLRPADERLTAFAHGMATSPGWRQATLDLSSLGSEVTYTFAMAAEREQVFGWAYQGARTARTVAALNEALEMRHYAYLVDRLDLLGVDDVVLATELPDATGIEQALTAHGLQPQARQPALAWLHRDGQPRAVRLDQRALGIGRGARNLAYLFPQIVIGGSDRLDDYALSDLLRYDRVILSGFSWRDRDRAEVLARQLAASGVRVIVDLTGTTPDPWARLPRFLDVWGERITLPASTLPIIGSGPTALRGFGAAGSPWLAHTLQGQVQATVSTRYLDQPATVVGYQPAGDGQVWFIGLNLPYHALLTGDAAALTLLAEVLDLTPHVVVERATVPLADYVAGPAGYRFRYQLSSPARLLVPVAAHDGARVTLDGQQPIVAQTAESLLVIDAPAGEHTVEITFPSPARPGWAWAISALALVGLAGLWLWSRRAGSAEVDA